MTNSSLIQKFRQAACELPIDGMSIKFLVLADIENIIRQHEADTKEDVWRFDQTTVALHQREILDNMDAVERLQSMEGQDPKNAYLDGFYDGRNKSAPKREIGKDTLPRAFASSDASELPSEIIAEENDLVKGYAEFEALSRPLIKWLNDNYHPHVTVIVTPVNAELMEGQMNFPTHDYIRD